MKKYLLLLLSVILSITGRTQPPNNLIFYGGTGNGISHASFSLAAGNIFSGGNGDGAGWGSNGSLSNNLFSGGGGDGVSTASNNALSNALFLGGAGDGFSYQSNNSVSNNIFIGSSGDGFSFMSNNAISNNIFTGGRGDGWSAVVIPLGPLPVRMVSFTAEVSGTAHLVKWVTSEEINTKHFEVQRSANGSQFFTAGISMPAGNPSAGAAYGFRVEDPWTGNNFYRLKIVDNDGSVEYSSIVLLKNETAFQLSIFPNPTADILHVRLPVMANTPPVKAVLYDANGKMLNQLVLKTGSLNDIPVSHLPAGVYSLHFIIGHRPVMMRFIKK
ncbi:MAG: T9SS type A sorting domain-containing protein [Chitinophagaceae bacterium]|nr:MAG: T9SS type A sorting domain-containing protein [Chitinophagaceae bacterium]